MYTVERNNILASRTMEAPRYRATVLQQNRMFSNGEDTDMGDPMPSVGEEAEGGESEDPSSDPILETDAMFQVRQNLRVELNNALFREAFQDASEIQACIMLILDSMNSTQPMDARTRIHVLQQIADRVERMADRQRQLGELVIADRYQSYSNLLRDMAASQQG